MSTPPGIAEQYRFAVDSFIDFARTLDDADWATMVPCTPDWTVRDVLSHVSGVPDDAAAGRMDGAPGEAWTAAQVERNRPFSIEELLDRWGQQAPVFADLIEQMGEHRPPIDCHSHEHDIRHAVGQRGPRTNMIVNSPSFAKVDAAVGLIVESDDGSTITTGAVDVEPTVSLRGVTRFELFRSRLGRRSWAQVRAYDWSGSDDDIEAVIARWFSFGPSPLPIIE